MTTCTTVIALALYRADKNTSWEAFLTAGKWIDQTWDIRYLEPACPVQSGVISGRVRKEATAHKKCATHNIDSHNNSQPWSQFTTRVWHDKLVHRLPQYPPNEVHTRTLQHTQPVHRHFLHKTCQSHVISTSRASRIRNAPMQRNLSAENHFATCKAVTAQHMVFNFEEYQHMTIMCMVMTAVCTATLMSEGYERRG